MIGQTLADKLSPVVDKIRSIPSRLGIRPYKVFLIETSWSGGMVGDGEEQLVFEREILPTPKADIKIGLDYRSSGKKETGDVMLKHISANYSEDDLAPRDLKDGHLFFIEIRLADARQIRCIPSKRPTKHLDGFGWNMDLLVQDEPMVDGRLYK